MTDLEQFAAFVRRRVHALSNLLTAMSCQCDLTWPRNAEAPAGGTSYDEFAALLRRANAEVQRLTAACADVSNWFESAAGPPANASLKY